MPIIVKKKCVLKMRLKTILRNYKNLENLALQILLHVVVKQPFAFQFLDRVCSQQFQSPHT